MNVLIGCEESGKVRDAFIARGHNAISCDLQPTRSPGAHHQGCIKDFIRSRHWDLIILHPDCTEMAVCANKHYAKGKPDHYKRLNAVKWTVDLWELAKEHADSVVLENPASVIFPVLRKLGALIFYIQPWQFGHGETKKTGLAVHNLKPLMPTDIVEGREQRIWKMAPSPTRKRDRSETYQGIADALADQYGTIEPIKQHGMFT